MNTGNTENASAGSDVAMQITLIVLDVLVLGMLIMDYMKTKEYQEELHQMKREIWRVRYEVSEMGDRLSVHNRV